MIFSRRRATTAISAATAFTLLTGLATVPSAHAAPVSTVDDVFLGVGADETEALLNWTTYGVATEYVEFAPASAAAGEQFPADTAKRVTAERGSLTIEALRYSMSAQITGLEENTEYVYRIGSDERGWTKTHTLTTGDFGDTWEFSVFGDPQIGASDDQAKDGDGWRAATAAAAEHPGTSMFVSVGDQVDSVFDGLTQQAEYDEFFNNDEISRYRTAVNRGNHDAPSKAYGEMFDLPNTDASGLAPYNYYFERNNTLFVALDTNAVSLAGQKQFLRDTVAAHGKDNDWIVVTYHHSTYS
ncbi:fibronectin type III domain-containing protein [Corynebacterium doosanense]|uniref:fibronectin type III domain-containing protein n=1 Tax=Corynebacterium doosanense TaxID=1121358 RepID=UPI0003705917|nr:fibronectin type III domain-containing protein [Corynebacterium doosanense]